MSATFGSISSGTMLTEDLLGAFASELEYQVQRHAIEWCSDAGRAQRDVFMALVDSACEIEDYDSEEASELVGDIFDALDYFAPPYAYFGAHEGDGSDYGYWLSSVALENFDGLHVGDTSEVPADYSGEVLHVNDHGNTALFTSDRGTLSEVWSLV